MLYPLIILAISMLVIIHEFGHYLVARAFGMRVMTYSIGFGPVLWKWRPKGSETLFQVAAIPMLAYVQIAGMQPRDQLDPNDRGSYQNASPIARLFTIAAGPLANYLAASVLMFFGFMLGAPYVLSDEASMKVNLQESGPAYVAGLRDGDRLVTIDGRPVKTWQEIRGAVSGHAGEPIDVQYEREGKVDHVTVTPIAKGQKNEGMILIAPPRKLMRVSGVREAAVMSVTEPPKVVVDLVEHLGLILTGREKFAGTGPVGIVKEGARAVHEGTGDGLHFLGLLSAYLGGFNLMPFPPLDGSHIATVFSNRIWDGVLITLLLFVIKVPSPLLWMILVVGFLFRLGRGGYTRHLLARPVVRVRMAAVYVVLCIGLAVGTESGAPVG